MKELLKKFIPSFLLSWYHWSLSWFASSFYGHPSEKLVVIGVTGTNGKSTVVNIIADILRAGGHRVGVSTTVNFYDGKQSRLNNLKMTMPGRFFLQHLMRKMVKNDCNYAVVETTSEGILQFRHSHIHYDVAVFTNLAPEHIERHGSFENYMQAKLKLFKHLQKLPHKKLAGKKVEKIIVVNGDDKLAREFADFKVDKKYSFSVKNSQPGIDRVINLHADNLSLSSKVTSFTVSGVQFKNKALLGEYNVENILAGVVTAVSQGMGVEECARAVARVPGVPGRLERIDLGQDFEVIVDYAPEPNSLKALYELLKIFPKKRLIHLLGSAGGGRDKSRRAVLGKMAGENADMVIVTNEDPYDEDPQAIIRAVADGAESAGKVRGESLLEIDSRQEAVRKALWLARPGDLVLLTGKGAEQAIVGKNGKKHPWDEREAVRQELLKLAKKS